MRKAELVFVLGILAFGGLFLVESLRLPYFVDVVLGPGFLPVWISVGIIVMGLGLTIRHFHSSSVTLLADPKPTGRKAWQRVGMLFGGLAVVSVLLESLGFLVITILYIGMMTFGLGMRSWRVLVAVSVLASMVLYVVFKVLLGMQLPAGILAAFGW